LHREVKPLKTRLDRRRRPLAVAARRVDVGHGNTHSFAQDAAGGPRGRGRRHADDEATVVERVDQLPVERPQEALPARRDGNTLSLSSQARAKQ